MQTSFNNIELVNKSRESATCDSCKCGTTLCMDEHATLCVLLCCEVRVELLDKDIGKDVGYVTCGYEPKWLVAKVRAAEGCTHPCKLVKDTMADPEKHSANAEHGASRANVHTQVNFSFIKKSCSSRRNHKADSLVASNRVNMAHDIRKRMARIPARARAEGGACT